MEKAKEISEDEQKAHETDIQKATNDVIAEIDQIVESKSAEIMQV